MKNEWVTTELPKSYSKENAKQMLITKKSIMLISSGKTRLTHTEKVLWSDEYTFQLVSRKKSALHDSNNKR